jgi:F-type H+-transporting ATPase subunit delta
MNGNLSAKRYAQAVFKIAVEHDSLDQWQNDFQKITELGCRPNLVEILENPKNTYEQKANLVKEALGDINPLALNLVYLLISKNIFHLACDIAKEFYNLLDEHRGIMHGEIITAVPISDEEKEEIAARYGAEWGKTIYLTNTVNPSIIGGFIFKVGDKIIDGSLTTKLAGLKEKMARGQ